jgi:hypothetical protein
MPNPPAYTQFKIKELVGQKGVIPGAWAKECHPLVGNGQKSR